MGTILDAFAFQAVRQAIPELTTVSISQQSTGKICVHAHGWLEVDGQQVCTCLATEFFDPDDTLVRMLARLSEVCALARISGTKQNRLVIGCSIRAKGEKNADHN